MQIASQTSILECLCVLLCKPLTSFPYIMRWWVVISALKTTTQLELAVRSNSVSASWGMFTFISLVQWMRSGIGKGKTELHSGRQQSSNKKSS